MGRMRDTPCIGYTDVLTPAELDRIVELGSAKRMGRGKVYEGRQSMRSCGVTWLYDDWLNAKVWEIAQAINDQVWQFELEGLKEPLQYTVYEPGDHFGWHMDQGPSVAPRKLSLSVQLSEPTDYDGGDFQVFGGGDVLTMPKERGRVLAFPGWIVHQVTPVTRGTRKALVAWVHGQEFR